jgi:bacterioferritin
VKGDPEIIDLLNEHLTAEFTAVHQYLVHSKMLEDWGFAALASLASEEARDELRHADLLIARILFLGGTPDPQSLFPVRIGQTVPEQFAADLALEEGAIDRLKRGIRLFRERADVVSANLFESILADEEHHLDFLETQLQLIKILGEGNYLARQIEPGGGGAEVPAQ